MSTDREDTTSNAELFKALFHQLPEELKAEYRDQLIKMASANKTSEVPPDKITVGDARTALFTLFKAMDGLRPLGEYILGWCERQAALTGELPRDLESVSYGMETCLDVMKSQYDTIDGFLSSSEVSAHR